MLQQNEESLPPFRQADDDPTQSISLMWAGESSREPELMAVPA
jgi:hypothetical protein